MILANGLRQRLQDLQVNSVHARRYFSAVGVLNVEQMFSQRIANKHRWLEPRQN
jgi:hypothetical protein